MALKGASKANPLVPKRTHPLLCSSQSLGLPNRNTDLRSVNFADMTSRRIPIRNAFRESCMDLNPTPGVTRSVASALILLLFGSLAAAQSARLKNIELCNGADRTSPQPQIDGCTALIDSGDEAPRVLAIAYNNRGNAHTERGEYDRAIQDYDQSVKIDPTYAKAFNNRGVAYKKKREYDRAIRDFDEAIKLDPSYASAFADRAQTLQTMGEYGRAARDYDEAIRLEPNLKPVWNGRCWNRAILGELPAALTDCNKALLLEPDTAAIFNSRGLLT